MKRPVLITPQEAARQLCRPVKTIYYWCRRGILDGYKMERCVVIDQASVDRFLANSKIEPVTVWEG